MPRPALICALLAGTLAGVGVAGQPVGLALSIVLVLVIAAAALGTDGKASRAMVVLAVALGVQPFLLDAGWVVAVDVLAALVAAAAAVVPTPAWRAVWTTVLAPLRIVSGVRLIAGASTALLPETPGRHATPVLRGVVLAIALSGCFGALFISADTAFAELADDVVTVRLDPADLLWRLLLGSTIVATAGALIRAARVQAEESATEARVPGRVESLIALAALVTLFAVFVGVQVRVLFGGASYVQATTGLGYGDYARQGFVQLLLVAALTLAVIAVGARRREQAARVLLGALCVLTLVVLASAYHRLVLVEDAYGLTRVRYGGHAVVIWLAAMFVLVLAAGTDRRIARAAPRVAVVLTLAGVLAFSLSNPDARIADRAVDRFAERGLIDSEYMSRLSADAVPALERLPETQGGAILPEIRARLARSDGLAGFNLSRRRAR